MSQELGARKLTDVAVGVVFSPDQSQVLFGQRPQGKPYAGWWELPGGKLEPGESVQQALVRELQEELGITAVALAPWARLEYDYPHAFVRLHVCRVLVFTGEPASLEQQSFAWSPVDHVALSPLLPATEPVLRWLQLPHEIEADKQAGILSLAQLRSLSPSPVDTQRHYVGAFVQSTDDLALAQRWSLDYLVLPVQQQWHSFTDLAAQAHLPVFAGLSSAPKQAGAKKDAQLREAHLQGAQGICWL